MDWHTAQMGFVVAIAVVMGVMGLVGLYVVSSAVWSDRWAVRRRPGGAERSDGATS